MSEIAELAKTNLVSLIQNPYPGRGIVVAIDPSASFLIQMCWIMGRSSRSRNRVYVTDGRRKLSTAVADPSLLAEGEDTSLIIYPAMDENGDQYVVSNGEQTIKALEFAHSAYDLGRTLRMAGGDWKSYQYEPDSPHHTPRITTVCKLSSEGVVKAQLSVLRRAPSTAACDQDLFERTLETGYGYCITTYSGDGDPLPSFYSLPLLVPIGPGSIEDIATRWWDNILNADNRVALAIKEVPLRGGLSRIHVINKHEQVVQ